MKLRHLLLLFFLAVFLGGCASSVTTPSEMFSAPNFLKQKQKPEEQERKGSPAPGQNVIVKSGDQTIKGGGVEVILGEVDATLGLSGTFEQVIINSSDALLQGDNLEKVDESREMTTYSLESVSIKTKSGNYKLEQAGEEHQGPVKAEAERAIVRLKKGLSAPESENRGVLPDTMVNVIFALPPRLDVADSAFLYDLGINTPSLCWKAVMWEKVDGDWEHQELKAVRFKHGGGSPRLLITIPASLKEVKDNYLAVADHAGRRIFNRKGRYIMRDWRKATPEEYSDFLTKINNANPLEISQGSREYEEILRFYKKFRVLEAIQFKNYVYKQEGIPIGTILTEEEIKQIDEKYRSHTAKLKKLFLEDWNLLFTYPLLTPGEYGFRILITKIFQVPSVWWGEDINRPGYMDRDLKAVGAYDMMDYYMRNYAPNTSSSGSMSGKLNSKEKQILREATGQEFQRYEQYLKWVREKNKEIQEYNESLE